MPSATTCDAAVNLKATMTTPTPLTLSPFAGLLQMAYVTTDLTQAIAIFSQRAEMQAQGCALVIDGQAPHGVARYFYTDHRAMLGHYIEHIWYSPPGLAHMAQLPRN